MLIYEPTRITIIIHQKIEVAIILEAEELSRSSRFRSYEFLMFNVKYRFGSFTNTYTMFEKGHIYLKIL